MVVIEFIYKFLLEVVDDFCVLEVVNIELVNIVCILMFSFGFDLPFHKCPSFISTSEGSCFVYILLISELNNIKCQCTKCRCYQETLCLFFWQNMVLVIPGLCLAHLVRRRVLLALMLPTLSFNYCCVTHVCQLLTKSFQLVTCLLPLSFPNC